MSYRQSFAWWSFAEAPVRVPDLLAEAAAIGYQGVDFLPEELWSRAKDLGLELVVVDGHASIDIGFNDPSQHADLTEQVRRALDTAHREGVHHLSVMSGVTAAAGDEEAVEICAEALAPLAAEAEQAGVGLLLEPLNTKIDHPGHQCRTTAWGAAVVDRVGSPALRILYDAYHMQIMEGDLLRTIAAHLDRIGHFHTAGVPGRQELDHRQEINWAALALSLREQGYSGFIGHEFIPRADPVAALRQAYDLFDPAVAPAPASPSAP
ncbi:hydroxypyruvate isomerase family protein [Streptomyces sp. NPDC048338]|uniref:hydroxypyruvate isomerase family protein n=1 Tax=Streptomyces sp. NPDC048338 TaxID=3365536 RepID=UPI0037202F8C